MRKLAAVLLALCASAFAAPVFAGDAFTGVCTFQGVATLSPAIGTEPQTATFQFATDGSATNACTGQLNGKNVQNVKASAVASGSGELSCVDSTGTGFGVLTINRKEIGFALTIYGTGPQVTFVITGDGGGRAAGQATFAKDTSAAGKCEGEDAGSLKFLIGAVAQNIRD